ncbi:MAG TPA: hypothetical protein VG757_00550 [Devosia sp.]|nr:hypothetical protein [Devosia sp.]
MTVVLLRIVIFMVIGIAIWLGLRRIFRDWTSQFRAEDKAVHERDLRERSRPDVITLKRDVDGTFRPPDNDNRK